MMGLMIAKVRLGHYVFISPDRKDVGHPRRLLRGPSNASTCRTVYPGLIYSGAAPSSGVIFARKALALHAVNNFRARFGATP